MEPLRNLITDVAGLRVGNAQDLRLGSGVSAVVFDAPVTASIAIHGGAPGGVMAHLREEGRGFDVRGMKVPIVPGAILFDLLNGGDKDWGRKPPYWDLGYAAAQAAAHDFALGSFGAGTGATTANYKGGLGSASACTGNGFRVGALVAVNAVGSTVIGDGPQFWAGMVEHGSEFGGLGVPPRLFHDQLVPRLKGDEPQNTTIAIVACDATLTKGELKRLAVMAHDGMARAIRPAHATMDGDIVFAAATGKRPVTVTVRDLTEIGLAMADCLARAIARGVYEARALPWPGAQQAWRERFASDVG